MEIFFIDPISVVFALISLVYVKKWRFSLIFIPLFFVHFTGAMFFALAVALLIFLSIHKFIWDRAFYAAVLFLISIAIFFARYFLLVTTISSLDTFLAISILNTIFVLYFCFLFVIGERGVLHWIVPGISYLLVRFFELMHVFSVIISYQKVLLLWLALLCFSALFVVARHRDEFPKFMWLGIAITFAPYLWKISIISGVLFLIEQLPVSIYKDILRVSGVLAMFWGLMLWIGSL